MLDIFATHYSLTESVGSADCTSHKFSGTFNEAADEFAYLMAANTYDIHRYATKSDEIIAECMMSDQVDKTDVLVENVFNDIFEQAKQFWTKLKEWVKGMIDKLKAFMYQMTGQYNKWASSMKSRVDKANPSDFSYVMHDWDLTVLDKLCTNEAVTSKVCNDPVTDYLNKAADAMGEDNALEKLNEIITDSYVDSVIHDAYDLLVVDLGFTLENYDIKTLRANIAKAVTRGEKITKKIDKSTASRMYTDVAGMSTKLKGVDKMYKNALTSLDKELKHISDIKTSANKIFAEEKSKEAKSTKASVIKSIHTATRICKLCRDCLNVIGNSATKYSKDYALECMSCLGAYCNAGEKGAKKQAQADANNP